MKTRENYRTLLLSLGWSVAMVNTSIDTYYFMSGVAGLEVDGLIQALPPALESMRGFVAKRFGKKPHEPKVDGSVNDRISNRGGFGLARLRTEIRWRIHQLSRLLLGYGARPRQ